jgi:hypothetical protein
MAFTGVVSGVRSSATGLPANQKPTIDNILRLIKPYQTPLTQWLFLSNKQSKVVTSADSKFSWFEDEFLPHQSTFTAAINVSGTYYLNFTSSNCTDVSFLKLNDLVYVEATDELLYVSTDTSSTDKTLTKVASSLTAPTAISAGMIGSYFKVVGSLNLENNSTPTFLSTKEVEKYNYCTIFLEGVASTGRDQASETYTNGTSHDEQVMKKMEEMKLQFERNFLFSNVALSIGSSTSTKKTVGKGFKGFFTSNAVSYSTTLTEVALDNFLTQIFSKGSMNRTMIVGNNIFTAINKIAKDKQGSFPAVLDDSYGGRIHNYIHGMGDVKIVRDPVMDGKFSYCAFIFDEDQVIPRHMANDKKGSRKFRIEANVETPGTDRTETKLLADIGIQVNNEELGGYLYKS